jgi:hypothetical protein
LGAYGTTPFDLGALPLAVHNVNHSPDLLPGKTVFCPFGVNHWLSKNVPPVPPIFGCCVIASFRTVLFKMNFTCTYTQSLCIAHARVADLAMVLPTETEMLHCEERNLRTNGADRLIIASFVVQYLLLHDKHVTYLRTS